MVVSSHFLWIYTKSNNFIVSVLELFGFWGVELFFVLSGFLIGSILYQSYVSDSFTLKTVFHFLKRRWFRTLPNYYLVLIANIFIAYFIGYQVDNIGLYFVFLQNFIHKSPVFFPESWSLSVEEFAYLLLPFALFFGTFGFVKNKSKRFLIIVFLLLIVFFFTKVIFNATCTISNLTAWIRFNFEVFWKKYKELFLFLGIGIFFFLLFGISSSNLRIEQSPFFWNVLYLPLTSLGFAFILPIFSEWKLSNSFLKNPIVFVSKISYAIYLIHYSVILQLMKYFVDTTVLTSHQRHFFTILYLMITFLMAYILYRFYEKPMMNLRDKI